jgi:hypothetical protein
MTASRDVDHQGTALVGEYVGERLLMVGRFGECVYMFKHEMLEKEEAFKFLTGS